MQEIDPSGDLVFSSTELGSGSVKKTAQIADILKDLLNEVVIVTRSEDNNLLLQKYYDKIEIHNLLADYTTLEKLSAEVEKQLEELLKDPSLSKFALKEDLDALNEVVKDYSNTIETIKGNQTALVSSWQEYKNSFNETIAIQNTSINNLSTSYTSLSSSVNNLQTILNNLDLINIANFSSQVSDIQSKLDTMESAIGNLANLKTSAKENLVVAINELVDNQGTLSSLKTSTKNSLVAAINELFQSASDGKSKIADAITGKGVSASATDSYATLANKIFSISTGVDTSDANITASDVTLGKIGYGSSGRIVGEHSCSGGSTDIASMVTTYDSSDNYLSSGTTKTICSGKSGIVVPIIADATCNGGDEIAEGSIYYVIDGTQYPVDNYLPYQKIKFNTSFAIKVGTLTFPGGGTECESCGGSPVFSWGGVVIAQ